MKYFVELYKPNGEVMTYSHTDDVQELDGGRIAFNSFGYKVVSNLPYMFSTEPAPETK